MNKEGRKHWYLVVVDRPEKQVILLDPNPTKFQDRKRRTATKLVATWMMTCVEASNFDIKVDEVNRMKIAVSLVLKDHNIIGHSIKNKAIENYQLQDDSQDRVVDDIYCS
ncbi:hypothetical protein PIB30_024166 [Stylosanthes scabra]|uniref:Ubiquitin-like protease family profile domain-containing protein n=1 Tax=Stylosanthes scabra TaxID=79078 RepID=A0ABU6Y6X4_9FABA|nr:hypothetical protein [Stylosanthes scabra]